MKEEIKPMSLEMAETIRSFIFWRAWDKLLSQQMVGYNGWKEFYETVRPLYPQEEPKKFEPVSLLPLKDIVLINILKNKL